MFCKEITFTDYNGREVTDKFYFNLNKAEIIQWLSTSGEYTLDKVLEEIARKGNVKRIMEIFADLIQRSYGEKSLDGRRFMKNKELVEAFVETEAYSNLFVELVTDANKAAEFINSIIPSDMALEVTKLMKENPEALPYYGSDIPTTKGQFFDIGEKMLHIVIPEDEYFNPNTNEFIKIKRTELQLEHSLISLKKWESKWHKPFLDNIGGFKKNSKTPEEILDYIKCMTITQNVDPKVYDYIPIDVLQKIFSYIEDPMTATWFREDKDPESRQSLPPTRRAITSELIYYWMIKLGIPAEFQKWHLNQLITLIRVINAEEAPSKKMSKAELLERNRKLNQMRRPKKR